VVLLPGSVHQDGVVRLRQAEDPARLAPVVIGTERIVEQALTMDLEDEAVAVGMLVIGGPAASESERGVIRLPSGPAENPVKIGADIQEGVRGFLDRPLQVITWHPPP